MNERLQKLLAGAGHGSRRGIEEWIRAGRVTINDRVAALGDRATHADRICLDGRPLDLGGRRESVEVLLYHKPVGEVTTRSDPRGPADRVRTTAAASERAMDRRRPAGREYLRPAAVHQRWRAGASAHAPLERDRARVPGAAARHALGPRCSSGCGAGSSSRTGRPISTRIEAESTEGSHTWFRVCLHEGRNREVRRLFEHEGFVVSRLSRLRYGSVELPR